MYNKTSFINEPDYAELAGLCGICPIMRKVTNYAHNFTIPTISWLTQPNQTQPTASEKNWTQPDPTQYN